MLMTHTFEKSIDKMVMLDNTCKKCCFSFLFFFNMPVFNLFIHCFSFISVVYRAKGRRTKIIQHTYHHRQCGQHCSDLQQGSPL
jgi:hypothetical protein